MVHKLLMPFFTVDCSIIEVFETYLHNIVTNNMTIQSM